MYDFRISYHDDDRAWEEWIAWELKRAGRTCCHSRKSVHPDTDWELELDPARPQRADEPRLARRVLVLASRLYAAQTPAGFAERLGRGVQQGAVWVVQLDPLPHLALPDGTLSLVERSPDECRRSVARALSSLGAASAITPAAAPPLAGHPAPSSIPAVLLAAEEDADLAREGALHFAGLVQRGELDLFCIPIDVRAGDPRDPLQIPQLRRAALILYLRSPALVANHRLTSWLDERKRSGEARLVSVALRSYDPESAPFSDLQGVPIKTMPVGDETRRDGSWVEVVQSVRRVLPEIRRQRQR